MDEQEGYSSGRLPARPRIAVVGSGAVGGYFGGALAETGAEVHFLMRRDLDKVRRDGLRVQRLHAPTFTLNPVQAHGSTADIGPCDLVLIAIKTTQNGALRDIIPPLLHEHTALLTLQNGMGNVELLEELFGPGRAMAGLVNMGINRTPEGVIDNQSPNGGYVTMGEACGPVSPRLRQVAELLEHAHIHPKLADDLLLAQWRKLVWNVPFNGLTVAAGGVTCDAVLDSPDLARLAVQLMRDVQAGARALGRHIPDDFIEHQVPYTRPLGAYKPSSLIDWQEGREMEVEAIWGEPLRRGTAAGASMPHLDALYALLKFLNGRNPAAPVDGTR